MARKKRRKDLTNQVPVDRFTAAHFGIGGLFGATDMDWRLFLVGSIGWEVLEHAMKKKAPQLFPNPSQDTVENAVCDVMAAGLGFGCMRTARSKTGPEKKTHERR